MLEHMRRLRSLGKPLAIFITLVSLSMNILLVREVRRLRSFARADAVGRLSGRSFKALTLEGRPTTVTLSDTRPSVLYVFTPQCSWCRHNAEKVSLLQKAVAAKGYDFLYLSLSSQEVKDFAARYHHDNNVVVDVDPSVVLALRLGKTPHTLVIGPDGTVNKQWVGAFTDNTLREIETYFGITL